MTHEKRQGRRGEEKNKWSETTEGYGYRKKNGYKKERGRIDEERREKKEEEEKRKRESRERGKRSSHRVMQEENWAVEEEVKGGDGEMGKKRWRKKMEMGTGRRREKKEREDIDTRRGGRKRYHCKRSKRGVGQDCKNVWTSFRRRRERRR